MKVVVIGGGIAGLCMGIYLQQNGIDVVINEKQVFSAVGGHAFLMHHDGFAVLEDVTAGSECLLPGKLVDTFIFKDHQGRLINEQQLDQWQCFKRTELLDCLIELLPQDHLKNERTFSHFIYEEGKIVAAAFLDGEQEFGDIFIGADGANSAVRQKILGEVQFEPGLVKEIVGIARHPELALALKGKFTKFQQNEGGLSFGMIPTSATEVVWFMQFDPLLGDVPTGAAARAHEKYPEQMRDLCLTLLKGFPEEVQAILAVNDFNSSYVWTTRDFDLLPQFSFQNVVLIGDAAHVALPFTSAGTTNALLDAKILTECLLLQADFQLAFAMYYRLREENIREHVQLGRKLRDAFLTPSPSFVVPLISDRMKQ